MILLLAELEKLAPGKKPEEVQAFLAQVKTKIGSKELYGILNTARLNKQAALAAMRKDVTG